MKLFWLIGICIPIQGFAQNNFYLNDGNVEWRKTIDSNISATQFIEKLKLSGNFEKIELVANKITAQMVPFEPDFKGAGYKRMFTPMYVLVCEYQAFVVIEYNNDQIIILVKRFVRVQKEDNELFGKMGTREKLETYATNKRGFTTDFEKNGSTILNYTLNKLFQ